MFCVSPAKRFFESRLIYLEFWVSSIAFFREIHILGIFMDHQPRFYLYGWSAVRYFEHNRNVKQLRPNRRNYHKQTKLFLKNRLETYN